MKTPCMVLCLILMAPRAALFAQEVTPAPPPQGQAKPTRLVHLRRLVRKLPQHSAPQLPPPAAGAILGGVIVFMGEANGCSPARPGGPCVSLKDVAIGSGVGALVGFAAGAAHKR